MPAKKKHPPYIRVGLFRVDEVLPHVFTSEIKRELRKKHCSYCGDEWKDKSRHRFRVVVNGKEEDVVVPMGSHRYQLFAEKGTVCANCGLKGEYFVLEKFRNAPSGRLHFNLYGRNEHGHEVMLTKDHIVPKSRGGKNNLENYQVLCSRCNNKKADKI